MYKYFAKTRFLGKNVIFLPECHSTNDFAKENPMQNGTIVITDYQKKGRGQGQNIWISEPKKNLLFTLVLQNTHFLVQDYFFLHIITALSIGRVLQVICGEKKMEIKWPNDVWVQDSKIAGVLIETQSQGAYFNRIYIGVGLNVNQENFETQSATSLKLLTGKEGNRSAILESLLLHFERLLDKFNSHQKMYFIEEYEKHLRWKNEYHYFKSDSVFKGKIEGINEKGQLKVWNNDKMTCYDFRELTFLY